VLVREHIYEKFEEDSDPISDMGIGLATRIAKWVDFINSNKTGTRHENRIDKYTINSDGTIDVGAPITKKQALDRSGGDYHSTYPEPIIIRGNVIKKLPDFIRFNKCYGDCFFNVSEIESLKGCPRIIFGALCLNADPNLQIDDFPDMIYGNVFVDRHHKGNELIAKCKVSGNVNWW